MDRQKRQNLLGILTKSGRSHGKTKIMRDAEVALASLASCEEALEREMLISIS